MPDRARAHLLIAGLTTRALAVSAARAGYRVTAIDAFGDLDLRAVATVIMPPASGGSRFDPPAAVLSAEPVSAGLVAYTSNLENYPEEVARLTSGRRLLGNPPEVLVRVRNPIELMRSLRRNGFATPKTRATPPARSRSHWLLKSRRSGGGHGVSIWHRGSLLPRSSYLQERIEGIPGSVVFAANGRGAVVLGLTRQLVGDIRFGAHGFRYCGSLLAGRSNRLFPGQLELLGRVSAMATVAAREFGLMGLNGIDFIARRGVPYPVEINPRYSASMELLERARGLSLFEVHAGACEGTLPAPVPLAEEIYGKAIVFARRDLTVGETRPWAGHPSFADVPHPGERIERGRPICTVFASERRVGGCMKRLVRLAAAVYRIARPVRRRAA
ncbi:MAG: ATP-grasp domain-containing protein [Gemmatimonadales bacterium]